MKPTQSLAHEKRRRDLQADIDAFLAAGGKVRKVAPGATGKPAEFGYRGVDGGSRRRGAHQSLTTRSK